MLDAVAERFGVRSFALGSAAGFSLNGRYLDLHGVNRHQDRIDRGWAIGPEQQDEDMALISEIGATALRLAHYQHSRYFYDLSDLVRPLRAIEPRPPCRSDAPPCRHSRATHLGTRC